MKSERTRYPELEIGQKVWWNDPSLATRRASGWWYVDNVLDEVVWLVRFNSKGRIIDQVDAFIEDIDFDAVEGTSGKTRWIRLKND